MAGSGWDDERLIETNDDTASALQIAMNTNGNALVIWEHSDSTLSKSIWAARYVAGNGWSTTKLITDIGGGTYSTRPEIAVDDIGNALAVWRQYDGLLFSFWASHYEADSSWSTAESISDYRWESPGVTQYASPQIILDNNGDALAVWGHLFAGPSEGILASRYEAGNGWSTAELIMGGAVSGRPQIILEANGNALAIWGLYDGTNGGIWANRYEVGSGWDKVKFISSGEGSGRWWPQIAQNADGNAFAVWVQNVGPRLDIWANQIGRAHV